MKKISLKNKSLSDIFFDEYIGDAYLSTCLLPYPLHKIARAGFALAAAHAWHVGELATESDEGVGF